MRATGKEAIDVMCTDEQRYRVTTHSMNMTEMYEYLVVGMDHDP